MFRHMRLILRARPTQLELPLRPAARGSHLGAKQDLPALDPCNEQQPHRRPGILREPCIDFLLAFGIRDQQELQPVAEWAAEDDEAVLHECVHEHGVLIPIFLLAQRERRVPVDSGLSSYGVVGHRALRPLIARLVHSRSSVTSTASTAPSGGSDRYCGYFSCSSFNACSRSSPSSSTRARPRRRIHHRRPQFSSYWSTMMVTSGRTRAVSLRR